MTVESADGRYGYRAWDRRPGDGVDPTVLLNPVEVIEGVALQAPMPYPADINQPRLLGVERTQPGIFDVLGVGPVPLMQDTPTRQDSGMQPSGTNW
jgi:hypothetical protein